MNNILKRKKIKEPWQISAARFCVNYEKGFKQEELFNYMDLLDVPKKAQTYFFSDCIRNPAGYKFGREHDQGLWTASIELVSMIIDYDELKEARKNAKHAWWFSIAALIIGGLGIIIQFIKT